MLIPIGRVGTIGATQTKGVGVPANALVLNGYPVVINGYYIVKGP